MKKRWIMVLLAGVLALVMLWPAAGGADAADGIVECESIEVTGRASGGASSDDMLQAYIDSLSDYAGAQPRRIANMGAQLEGITGALYRKLVPMIEEVAAGRRASTVFFVPYTALGVPAVLNADNLHVAENEVTTQTGKDAAWNMLSFDHEILIDALLADCPYALYWYDKTQNYYMSRSGFYINYSQNCLFFEEDQGVTLKLPVASAYSAGDYTFNTSSAATVQSAVARAAGIVAQYSAASDYDKLVGYFNEICGLTSYNHDAANSATNTPYGDPWQLVHVFDGVASTTVVCEGYSKAFQYLCDLTRFTNDVTCVSVTGYMNGGNHMWNLVHMPNDKVYLVDVTNCDESTLPGQQSIGYPDLLFMAGYASGDQVNGYFFSGLGGPISYIYDDETTNLYSSDQLEVSATKYANDNQSVVEKSPWEYTLDGENAVISLYTGPGGDVVVPDSIENHPVTGIGHMAFRSCLGLTGVVIPEGVVSVGEMAFYECANLASVTMPASVTSIGTNAFAGCGLTAFHCYEGSYAHQWAADNGFGEIVQIISTYVASGTCGDNLTWTLDGDGLLAISGTGAMTDFAYDGMPWYIHHDAITAISLPEGLTRIGDWAFEFSTNLTGITLPGSLTSIGGGAFINCPGLTNVVIPDQVTSIGSAAFQGCQNLSTVTIPASVTEIGMNAFNGCAALTRIILPAGVTSIGSGAFSGCNSLTIFTPRTAYTEAWAAGNTGLNIIFFDEAWYEPTYEWANDHRSVTATRVNMLDSGTVETETTTMIDMSLAAAPTDTQMGATAYVARFVNSTFQARIEVVDIPALNDMDVLHLPASLARIEAEAFAGLDCQAVIIPDSYIFIDSRAFAGCLNLIYVRLPENADVAADAFDGCNALRQPRAE